MDDNLDGVRQPAEPGIGGVTLDLYVDQDQDGQLTSADSLLASAVTQVDGRYSFAGLAHGHYLVVVSDHDGLLLDLQLTTPPMPAPVELVSDGQTVTVDLGYASMGLGGGRVLHLPFVLARTGR